MTDNGKTPRAAPEQEDEAHERGASNFDLIARPYQVLEYLALGSLLEQVRTHFVPELAACHHALLLGDGDGRFLARLLAINRSISVDAVDTSGAMLAQLCRRARPFLSQDGGRWLRTHHQDALRYTPDHAPDLIVSHFFFDCLTQVQLDQLIRRLVPMMAPGALWLVSDFRIPTGKMRLFGAVYVRALYFAFRLLTGLRVRRLPEHAAVLKEGGLERTGCHSRLFGLLTTELWRKAGGACERKLGYAHTNSE